MEKDSNNKDEDLEQLISETMNLPPISGDMVKDYTGLINKEMAATAVVWAEYKNQPEAEKNPLITNHMSMMVNMYTQLLKGADMFSDPAKVEELLKEKENKEG